MPGTGDTGDMTRGLGMAPCFVHDLLDRAAAASPAAPAVTDATGTWTYAQLERESRRAASWLLEEGVRRGQRLVARVPDGRETVALLYGASRSGVTLVPLSVEMKRFHLRGVLADADPALVVVADAEVDATRALTDAPVLSLTEATARMAGARGGCPVPGPVTGHDVALLVYTSGSTGSPKAIVSPHRPVVFAASSIAACLRYRPDDVVFVRLPLSFDYGLYQALLCALAGAHLVIAEPGSDVSLLRHVERVGATVIPVVPSLAETLARLAGRRRRPTTVRMFTNTGAALPATTIAALRRGFPGARVVLMFGTTECKRISILEPDGDLEKPGSVGRPIPGTEVLVLDEDGRRPPAGEHGEIVVRGPHVMAGYWRAPDLTAERFRRDPATGEVMLLTGDYGRVDDDGHLYFTGRRDDVFKRKGARVSVLEVEAAALDVPGVRAAAVPPPSEGAPLVLFAVADGLSPVAVIQGVAERLEPAKVPDRCVLLDALPLTTNRKADKRRLAELAGAVR